MTQEFRDEKGACRIGDGCPVPRACGSSLRRILLAISGSASEQKKDTTLNPRQLVTETFQAVSHGGTLLKSEFVTSVSNMPWDV